MPNIAEKWIVDTDWLAEHLDAPDLVVLDATVFLPTEKRDPYAEFLEEHIPGAHFFSIKEIADTDSPLPNMLPSTAKFASRMKKMGVGDGMRVIVYDTRGMSTAPRAWWMFRVMGHEDVAVLDGGLRKWKAEGRPVEDGEPPQRTPRHFTPRFNAELVRDLDDMKALVSKGGAQILDARAADRFAGSVPEPREGLEAGHIPGSINTPNGAFINPDGTLKPVDELRAAFEAAGVKTSDPTVTTCGSGVSAAILSLALAMLGNSNSAVYDGSWSEWGAAEGVPIATGA